MSYPQTLSPQQVASRCADFCEDLKGKTLDEIRRGCMRYRRNPENKFFPTPGQLLEACRNPFADAKPRRYETLAELGPAPERSRVEKMITLSRDVLRVGRPSDDIASVKLGILDRPPLEMTPELREREQALASERQNTLARRLEGKSW